MTFSSVKRSVWPTVTVKVRCCSWRVQWKENPLWTARFPKNNTRLKIDLRSELPSPKKTNIWSNINGKFCKNNKKIVLLSNLILISSTQINTAHSVGSKYFCHMCKHDRDQKEKSYCSQTHIPGLHRRPLNSPSRSGNPGGRRGARRRPSLLMFTWTGV